MDKNGVIKISNWQSGIATSPYLGFADVRNCEIHYPDGVLKIALAPTKLTDGAFTQFSTWMSADRTNNVYYFGGYEDGKVYKIASSIVTQITATGITGGVGGGLFWKNYLLITNVDSTLPGNDKLMAYNPSSPGWTTVGTDIGNSVSLGDVTPMYWAQNDVAYIGLGKYLSSLSEVAAKTFDPTDATTYTLLNKALDVYNYYKIDSITELGVNLMLGGSRRPVGTVTGNSFDGKIFPWDTTSPTFRLPILTDEGGVKQMISRNGNIIFTNGTKGNYFMTNGSSTQQLPEIGLIKNNPQNISFNIWPQACDFVNSEYLFGISTQNAAFTPAGVYGFKNNTWRLLEISTGGTGASGEVEIGFIFKKDETNFYVGWKDGTSSGIDEFGFGTYRYTGYRARVDTQLYSVGTPQVPKQLQKLQFGLGKPLAVGQGIRFSYRFDLNSSWVLFATYDFATYGAITKYADKCAVPACDNVQFRIELTTGVNSTTSPELIDVEIS